MAPFKLKVRSHAVCLCNTVYPRPQPTSSRTPPDARISSRAPSPCSSVFSGSHLGSRLILTFAAPLARSGWCSAVLFFFSSFLFIPPPPLTPFSLRQLACFRPPYWIVSCPNPLKGCEVWFKSFLFPQMTRSVLLPHPLIIGSSFNHCNWLRPSKVERD